MCCRWGCDNNEIHKDNVTYKIYLLELNVQKNAKIKMLRKYAVELMS